MLTIIGRRWFDRVNGNTYHSVELYGEDGKRLAYVPFRYGYGDQYRQTAFDEAVKLGLYSGEEYPESGGKVDYRKFNFSKPEGDGNFFSVSDVARKKDL
jgi:hypothetical protein